MAERTLPRSVPPVSGHLVEFAGGKRRRLGWKTARNGVPLSEPYEWNGIPEDGDPVRDAEVGTLLAAIRAEAARRVLKPGERGERLNRHGEWVPFRRPREVA